MTNENFQVESKKPFSESLIWQLNHDFYITKGVDAWRKDVVPHHLTSNAVVGKTYAELIFAFLKDLANKGQTKEKVYFLELGAGHGRLAFYILKYLDRLTSQKGLVLPPYCYVLSDIGEDNLSFFETHKQFQSYFKKGLLEVAYFDALETKEILLRKSGERILPQTLRQPILVIANYFFDSIPKDLFHFKNKEIFSCSISLESPEDPKNMDAATLLKNIKVIYHDTLMETPYYKEDVFNEMIESYRELVADTYLFFPKKGLQCLQNLQLLSQKGLMILSMDKGFHEIHDLDNSKKPEMITHGSMSFWVNYHALGAYCEREGGLAYFPSFSTFHLELGCLLFLSDCESYAETQIAYQRSVNDFGPDDFNGFKRFAYRNIANMNLAELIGMMRLSYYDSTFFINILPRLKQVSQQISVSDRARLSQTMHQTWDNYFTLNESYDLAFEIGGMFYALGYYQDALNYFDFSVNLYGDTADVFFNSALCHYQMREDALFLKTLATAKSSFPLYDKWSYLDSLDLKAV